jgi:hypothetical protein
MLRTYDCDAAFKHIARIGVTLTDILKRARRLDIPTIATAHHIAEDRFRALEAA